ncbi:uncharacterized protein C8Q71DRAFT_714775, partial [Rhodofomes roseus]
ATLPPNLVASVQEKPPELLKHARATSLSAPDFAALRSTIAGELARVQGSSEELLQRVQGSSQELLQRVFLREAGEFLREAVHVVPPEPGEGSAGVVWDSTDVWMIPTYSPAATPTEGAGSEWRKGGLVCSRALRWTRRALAHRAVLLVIPRRAVLGLDSSVYGTLSLVAPVWHGGA